MKQVNKTTVASITVKVANNSGINTAIDGLNKNIKTLNNADKSAGTNFAKLIIESINTLDYIQNCDLHAVIMDEVENTPLKAVSTYKRYKAIMGFMMRSKVSFDEGKKAINALKKSGMNALHKAIADTKKEIKRAEAQVNIKPRNKKAGQKRVDTEGAKNDALKVEVEGAKNADYNDNIKAAINTAKSGDIDVIDAIASIKKIKAIFDDLNHEKLAGLTTDQLSALKAAELMLSKAFK